MISLYHYPSSPCAGKVRAVLAEKQIGWDSRLVDIAEKQNLTPEYLKLNPKGVVPTLIDGERTLTESTIIMEYLDTAYQRDSLKPADPFAQAMMRRWTKWVDETLHPNWAGIAWTSLIRPDWLKKTRSEVEQLLDMLIDPARRARQLRLYEQGFAAPEFVASMTILDKTFTDMETALSKSPWLAGSAPSLADLAVLPYVISVDKFGLGSMYERDRPAMANWYQRWKGRASYDITMPWSIDEGQRSETSREGEVVIKELRRQAALKAEKTKSPA